MVLKLALVLAVSGFAASDGRTADSSVKPERGSGPSVVVSASYPGANARVVADAVAAPIEQQINGVEEMVRMESESRNDGSYSGRVLALGNLGLLYWEMGQLKNSIQLLEQSLKELEKHKPPQPLVKTRMSDGEGGDCHLVAGSPHRLADGVIVRKLIGESGQSTDP